ncbi:Mu transposase C-terminal domain-containing protein [Paraburkholderia sp. BR14263]
MASSDETGSRAKKVAAVLRPLGRGPLTRVQAKRAGQLFDVHWTTVYRLRQRFLANPVTSALDPQHRGPTPGGRRLSPAVDNIIEEVVQSWLPAQPQLAHPATDLVLEIRRRCVAAGVEPPSRSTVARRWSEYCEQDALRRAALPESQIAPGTFRAHHPLDIVQVDHTQADVLLVGELDRKVIGRPWLSVALDVATRCVLGFYVGMERPGAATVGLLLTRVALSKTPWLAKIRAEAVWPMRGIPRVLHLDNAAEFKSRALRSGCREYGIDLMYRPVGRPHFGGHIERFNRTIMERVRGLPGATGSSTKGRKARQAEKGAALTLGEFERWLAIEIGRRYHQSPHRGLLGATPSDTWRALSHSADTQQLPAAGDAELRFLIWFLPFAQRTIQADGLTIFRIRYWHPLFAAWRETRRSVSVRYHPEDLSRIFVSGGGKEYFEVRYADLRRPSISLFEQRTALKSIRVQGQRSISESMIFRAVEDQRRVIADATRGTRAHRRPRPRRLPAIEAFNDLSLRQQDSENEKDQVDYDSPVKAYDVEQW